MAKLDHLNENIHKFLDLSKEERITKIKSPRWIGYSKAKKILNKLEDLLVYPKTHRMPNLLIVGDTNNGKTMIISRFHKVHPSFDNPNADGITVPVLNIQAPPSPDESRFYNSILEKLFALYKPNDRVDKKQFQVIRLMKILKVKILVLDEFHHIVVGNPHKQRHFLNVIKYLGNELEIPIVGVGTKEAFNAIQSDSQHSNRFEPVQLPKWTMNDDYLMLLASFERMIPLKEASNLCEDKIAEKILLMSEGIIGEISSIIIRSAIAAIESSSEKISPKTLNVIDWTMPSERKWKAKTID